MIFLTSKKRSELYLIIIIIPLVGSLISKALNIEYVNWISFAHLAALNWQFETILKLNRILKKEFNLTLTKVSFSICILLLLVSLYNFKPENIFNIIDSDFSTAFLIVGMIANLSYFYVIYVLTRMYSRATTGDDLRGFKIFPTYFYFLVYPIGIWKYQNHMMELESKIRLQHE